MCVIITTNYHDYDRQNDHHCYDIWMFVLIKIDCKCHLDVIEQDFPLSHSFVSVYVYLYSSSLYKSFRLISSLNLLITIKLKPAFNGKLS